jgi:hypothetical protein
MRQGGGGDGPGGGPGAGTCFHVTRWKWLMGPSSRVQAPLFFSFFLFSFYQTYFVKIKKEGGELKF